MKRSILKFIVPVSMIFLTLSYSCKKFLDKPVLESLNTDALANKAGVDGLLIGAYAMLNMNSGNVVGNSSPWGGSVSNWHFGGIGSDDANKGSNPTDQPDAAAIMNHSVDGSDNYLGDKWGVVYTGVQRANDVLREIPMVKDGSLTPEHTKEVIAEAKFLRAVYHLEAAKIWRNVPWVDETITYQANNFNVPNSGPIWDKIEAELIAAVADLPATQAQTGRANKYAAEAFLAKAYMFDHKYNEANAALKDIMTAGVNSSGVKFKLNDAFADNFDASKKNGSEAVFAVQMVVNDQSQGNNGNPGDVLNFPAAGPATCCGFYQPSFSLVDAFKVDANGLPLLDGSFDNALLKSDQGVSASDATYFPDVTTAIDPRLDWTAGRRGIPFLDWGIMPGASWARAQGDAGPYINIKNIYRKSQQGSQSESFGGWAANQSDAINFNMIRFSDIILWAAECEVEVGTLTEAERLVNLVRERAGRSVNVIMGRLTGYGLNAKGEKDTSLPIVDNAQPAANYQVKQYAGQIIGGSKEHARQAVWFERRLELAMEGHRFFDLQRYDGTYGGPEPAGYMADIMNAYIAKNTSYDVNFFANTVMKGAKFTKGKNELYPIPTKQIDLEKGALKQNPGY